ncbi:hypothetical protein V8F06_014496 [Rhypophila decipiens]
MRSSQICVLRFLFLLKSRCSCKFFNIPYQQSGTTPNTGRRLAESYTPPYLEEENKTSRPHRDIITGWLRIPQTSAFRRNE